MKKLFLLSTLSLVFLFSACLPKHPERTVRPNVPLDPWTEHTVASKTTNETYRYLHLAGPSPDAPNMLLLPGGFFDARIWLYFDALAKHFNLYALDWPNESSRYKSSVRDMSNIASDFLTSLNIDKVHVTGVSAGAYPSIDLATKYKKIEVQSITLVSSVMFGISKKEIRSRKRNTRIALCLEPDKMRATAEKMAMRNEYKKAPGHVQQKDIFWVRPYTYYKQLFEMTYNQDDRKQDTFEIKVPVLIMHGTDDEIIDYDTAKENHNVFNDAEQIAIDKGLHSMAFSDGPELTKIMLAFFLRKGLIN